jgi:hypothetical protein
MRKSERGRGRTMDIPDMTFPEGITLENCTMEQYREALEGSMSQASGGRALVELIADQDDNLYPVILTRIGVGDSLYADFTGNIWVRGHQSFHRPYVPPTERRDELYDRSVALAKELQQEAAPDHDNVIAAMINPALFDEPEPPVETITGTYEEQTYTLTPIAGSTTHYCDNQYDLWIKKGGEEPKPQSSWPPWPLPAPSETAQSPEEPFIGHIPRQQPREVILAKVTEQIYTVPSGNMMFKVPGGYDHAEGKYKARGFFATPEQIWETIYDSEGNAYVPLHIIDRGTTPMTAELIEARDKAVDRIYAFQRPEAKGTAGIETAILSASAGLVDEARLG